MGADEKFSFVVEIAASPALYWHDFRTICPQVLEPRAVESAQTRERTRKLRISRYHGLLISNGMSVDNWEAEPHCVYSRKNDSDSSCALRHSTFGVREAQEWRERKSEKNRGEQKMSDTSSWEYEKRDDFVVNSAGTCNERMDIVYVRRIQM